MHYRSLAALVLCLGGIVSAADQIPIPNGNFEAGSANWSISEKIAMSRIAGQPANGSGALLIRDADEKEGSGVASARFALRGPGKYTLTCDTYPVSGSGLGIYVRLYDAAGKQLANQETQAAAPGGNARNWQPFTLVFYTAANAASADIWVHSYSHAKVEAALDNFALTHERVEAKSPWPGTYKISPEEKERLTEADVVGPDGIVYPDWRYAGMPGGIPQVEAKATIEQFGAAADDGKDDSVALQNACNKLSTTGSGAILLGPGTYHLDKPVHIISDGIVIRGSGQEKTRLIFRYAVPAKTVQFFGIADGGTVTRDLWLEAHAHPADLQSITVFCDDKQIARVQQAQHSGNMFSVGIPAGQVASSPGPKTLKAIATYHDGTTAQSVVRVEVPTKMEAVPPHIPRQIGAISFAGESALGPQLKLASDGKRGDRQIDIADASSILPGDRVRLRAPATPRWNALVQNACKWGDYRRYDFFVEAVDGNTLTLNQPLRIEFPTIDGSYVQELKPIRNCGIEDLTIEQVENLWINAVTFSEAWECWARGVTVKMAGRNPLYTLGAKWCEIRDCTFDDAHFKGGGGTAYGGFEITCDSLMENVTTYKLRHAPLFQWSASGNVIRNSTFHASDAQWHSGWTNENLFENCVINAQTGNGAYGYGMWASPPEDEAHGPNGPRNVIYNCDVKSPKAGLWMGGMNENWLVLYNRFDVGAGPAVYAKTGSFDHIIRGNRLILRDNVSPAVLLATPDCTGVELMENAIAGGSQRASGGAGQLLRNEQNTITGPGNLDRPTPVVPSIFDWQRSRK